MWCLCAPLCPVTAIQLCDVPELTDSHGSRLVLQRASLIASSAHFGDKLVVSWSRLCEQTVQFVWTGVSAVFCSSYAMLVDSQLLQIRNLLLSELVNCSKPIKSFSMLLGYRQACLWSRTHWVLETCIHVNMALCLCSVILVKKCW